MAHQTDAPAALIERHMRMYHSLQRAQSESASPGAAPGLLTAPYVAISRQRGAGGSELAAKVAARLGWTLYDKRLVEAIADDAHLQQRLVEPFDERRRTQLEDWVTHLLSLEAIHHHAYTRSLLRVLTSLGQVGRVVIVGRGAHLALPPERGLRVWLTGPLEARLARLVQREGLNLHDARHEVARVDKLRHEYLLHTFGDRAAHPEECFDLVVNTSSFSPDAVVALLVAALEAKCGPQPVVKPLAEPVMV